MIFDDISRVIWDAEKQVSVRELSRRIGLHHDKIARLAQGQPFNLDYATVFALQKLGYEICLEKREKGGHKPGNGKGM